ncbi:MAG: hypothetical protein MI975_03735 [Cytophagales bacterium]|nr:hypothetical protein [Cytophagales bacterium]
MLVCLIVPDVNATNEQSLDTTPGYAQKIDLLLSRLDLKNLEEVKGLPDNRQQAVESLPYYFKNRRSVKHPITENSEGKSADLPATERDFKYAGDALEHIFVGQPAYPSYFCGADIDWNFRPVPDMEWVWQLNRMYFWNSMGKVYAQTGSPDQTRWTFK